MWKNRVLRLLAMLGAGSVMMGSCVDFPGIPGGWGLWGWIMTALYGYQQIRLP